MKAIRINKLILILTALIIGIVSVSSCMLIKENDKNNILNAYTAENSAFSYYTFKATVKSIRKISSDDGNNKCFEFDVDYDYFAEQYSDDNYTFLDGTKRWEGAYDQFNRYEFWVDPANYSILAQNNGYDLLVEGAAVTISANIYYGWAGWRFPILGLKIYETTYLDFETGKENYLSYVRAGFKV